MAQRQATKFAFVGNEEVGRRVAATLEGAGFTKVGVGEADAVFTYCTNIPALEDAYYDTAGLLSSSASGAILVDLSPSTVSFARELNAVALVSDRLTVDAPVVVRSTVAGDAFADPANLAIAAGCDAAVYSRVEPMLSAIAAQVMWMGEAGAGQAAKVATTLQAAAALVGAVEGCAAAKSAEVSIDLEDLADFWAALGALTPAQEAFFGALIEEDFEGSYTIEHLMGEVAAALSSIDDSDLILPQAEAGFRLMELLALVGGVAFNPAALTLVFADDETSKRCGIDWSRAEGVYEDDHECSCGHDHGDGGCGCGHHHHDDDASAGYVSFSSN